MENKNALSVLGFIGVIVILIVGGIYLTSYKDSSEKNSECEKINKDKEYVYFENEQVISEEAEFSYKDIKINIDSQDAKNIENTLNEEMKKIRGKETTLDGIEYDELVYDYDNLYEADIIEYNVFENDNYITIQVESYKFNALTLESPSIVRCYTLDKCSGKLQTNQDIIKKHNLKTDEIRNIIYKNIKDIENVDIDVTMNNPYTLYYDKYENVFANILVNINDISYNTSIQIN